MSQLSLALAADVGFLFVAVGILVFGTYKAFVSRKVLVDPSYRKWAVWTGVLLILGIPYEIELARRELGVGFAGPISQAYVAAVVLQLSAGVSRLLLLPGGRISFREYLPLRSISFDQHPA